MLNIFKKLSIIYFEKDAELKDIKFIRSHAQAIGQCQNIININKFKTIISADTAGSAKDLSQGSEKILPPLPQNYQPKYTI